MRFEDTELFQAISKFNADTPEAVSRLLEGGADVHLRGEYQETYLHVLVGPDCDRAVTAVIKIIYLLARAGIQVNCADIEGHTALHVACLNDVHPRIANTLIKVGADPCLLNHEDKDSLDLAEDVKIRRTLELLDPGLWRAVGDDDTQKVSFLLDCWCKTDLTQDEKTLLQYAEAVAGETVMDAIKEQQSTVELAHAALSGDEKLTELLTQSADVNINTIDPSYVRENGKMAPMPLVGEVSLIQQYNCATILLKAGADVNIIIESYECKSEPLFFHLLKHCVDPPAEFLDLLYGAADTKLLLDYFEPVELLFAAWKGDFPTEFTQRLIRNPHMLSWRNHEGLTVRDKIFLESFDSSQDDMRKNLYFIDKHVIAMATSDQVEQLRQLALEGYEHIIVRDVDRTSIKTLAGKHKARGAIRLLQEIPELQKRLRELHLAIAKGNLTTARDNLTTRTVAGRDRLGRTALHLAVMYERRFIISYILKEFPSAVSTTDYKKRTPLHYACALPDGNDIEEALIVAGSDTEAADVDGRSPSDYAQADDFPSLIEKERDATCGLHVYVLERCMQMVDAIQQDDLDRVREIREGLYEDITISELSSESKAGVALRPLLFHCIDYDREDIALYLLAEGANYNISSKIYKENGEREAMDLLEAAQYVGMDKLVKCITTKVRADREIRAQLDFHAEMTRMNEMAHRRPPDGRAMTSYSETSASEADSIADEKDNEKRTRQNPTPPVSQKSNLSSQDRSAACTIL